MEILAYRPDSSQKLTIDRPMLVAWSTVAGPQWNLLVMASEASILSEATALRDRLALVSKLMLAGLVLFYLLFFAFLWRRSLAMTARVAKPLADIERNMVRISEGESIPQSHSYEATLAATLPATLASARRSP